MAQNQPTADELRRVAAFVDEQSATTAETTQAQPVLAIGDLQQFPQPAPEDRDSEPEAATDVPDSVVTKLLDLAAILDAGGDVSADDLEEVQEYVERYRAAQS